MNSKFNVFKYKSNKLNNFDDHISIEEPLEIALKYKDKDIWIDKTISVTMRTPGDDEDLVRGFLFNEKIIDKLDYIEKIESAGKTTEQYDLKNKITVTVNNSENIDIDKIFLTQSSFSLNFIEISNGSSIEIKSSIFSNLPE